MLISIFLILSEIHIISKDVLAVFYIPSTLFFKNLECIGNQK